MSARARRVLVVDDDVNMLRVIEGALMDEGLEVQIAPDGERALALLPEDYRIALTLRDVYGCEYHEIAGVLLVAIGTIESRVFRARRRLRPLLRQWLKRYSPSHADLHGCVRVDRAQRRR